MVTVADVMTAPAVAVRADEPVATVVTRFVASGLRHLAVVEADGRCLGVLADRVVALVWPSELLSPGGRRAAAEVLRVLVPRAPHVHTATPIADAAAIMVDSGVDALAVLDAAGSLVGVVTATDLLRALAAGAGGPRTVEPEPTDGE